MKCWTSPGTRFFAPDGTALPKTGGSSAESKQNGNYDDENAFGPGRYCSAPGRTDGYLQHPYFPSNPRRFRKIEGGSLYQIAWVPQQGRFAEPGLIPFDGHSQWHSHGFSLFQSLFVVKTVLLDHFTRLRVKGGPWG